MGPAKSGNGALKKPAIKPANQSAKSAAKASVKGAVKGSTPSMSVGEVVAWLKRSGTKKTLDGMSRYGIPSTRALGVTMAAMKAMAKTLGRDHALAGGLWATGWYEARMLAALVDEPERLTLAQMNGWVDDFDNWAICDTVCFALFDRSPLAWERAAPWAGSDAEWVKRTGFVLMACLAHHDKAAAEADFLPFLPLIEKGARDERNFVKKGVSWALRAIGRRSPKLRIAALAVAERLALSKDDAARWVGKDALRDLHRASAHGKESGKKPGKKPGKKKAED